MRLTKVELTPEQIEAFGKELDALEARTRAKVGAEDALYIRKMLKTARGLEVGGRALLLGSLFPPAWVAGTAMLGVAKILDNMEIGHNVMHGQYDFMNDPLINTKYEWDNVSDGEGWRHGHNYVHHTYTNVLGVDHDIGYRIVRTSPETPWHPRHMLNLWNTFWLGTLFEWGVGVHDMNLADAGYEDISKLEVDKVWPFAKKLARQVMKDYVVFPLLSGPMALPVLAGNAVANLIRNYWAWAVIFCGHFPEGTAVFTQESLANESRGQWYVRQLLGSANIEGGKLMHVMTGHLSHQIEHHLFPNIPAWRYPEMAVEVRAIAKKYGLQYNTGSFGKQVFSMLKQIARLSLPVSREDATQFISRNKHMIALKDRGMKILNGEHRLGASAAAAVAEKPRGLLKGLAKAFGRSERASKAA